MPPLRKNRIKQVLLNPLNPGDVTSTEFNNTLDAALSNPEHLIQLADFIADYHPKLGFTSDRIKKQAKTESVKEFKRLMTDTLDTKTKVTGSSSKQFVDEAKLLQKQFDY